MSRRALRSLAFAAAGSCLVGCASLAVQDRHAPAVMHVPSAEPKANTSTGRVTIEAPSPVGWSGKHPVWSVTLGKLPASAKRRHLFVADIDGSGAIVPAAALDLGPDGRVTPVLWPRPEGGVMLVSADSNALWSSPWRDPLTLPAGKAIFDPSGSKLLVARGGDLETFETTGGMRLFALSRVGATGFGAFVTPDLYAESGPSSERCLVVDVAKGTILVDEPAIAYAVSPSGKLVALLNAVDRPNAMPDFRLTLLDLGARSKPRSLVDLGAAPLMSGMLSLQLDGDRGVAVLLSGVSALMHEGSTTMLSYVSLASRKREKVPKDYALPDRSSAFARIEGLATPSLKAPRVAIADWLHGTTFDEDRAGARVAFVSGIPIADGLPSHAGEPSLVFIDSATKKLVREVPLPAADLTIEDVSLAPGGRSGMVCAREKSFLVNADTGEVISGSFDCMSTREGLWSPDGEHLLTSSGVMALHPKTAPALREMPTKACLVGTLLSPAEACR